MKKITAKALAAAAACTLALGTACVPGGAAEREITVTLNGAPLHFSQPPVAVDGTTMVPMRGIFEALGMDVSWNGGDGSVTAVKNGKSAFVTVGSTSARINGEAVELTQAPMIENGTTLVPLRVISEAMGVDVTWDQDNYTVAMTDEEKTEDETWKSVTGNIDLSAMTVDGPGLSVEGKTVFVTEGGDFTVTGTNGDAMIRVNTESRVKLRLGGVDLTNTDGPAIFFENCDKGFITLSKGTENRLADGESYSVDAKGTLFSNDDLEIKGGGSLTVTSVNNHAVACDDKLTVEEGVLVLNAVGDGIHANDGVEIKGGDISIDAVGDGIQSEGYVDISGGVVNVTTTGEVAESTGDRFGFGGRGMGGGHRDWGAQPLDGQQPAQMTGGQQPPELPDGQQPTEFPEGQRPADEQPPQPFEEAVPETQETADYPSTKGIKAESNLLIRGGNVTVNSADHCLHSEDIIYINEGVLNLTSQKGKGISAHQALSIDGGSINVLKSTEGIESKGNFAINGGDISVKASDDGLNAGGTDGRDAGANGHALYLNGGTVYVDADGDGLDANGFLYINGGSITVNGPTNSGNGALDSGGSVAARGGTLVASGASGMAEYPRGDECTQPTLVYNLPRTVEAGELLRIEDSNGSEILTYESSKPYQNIVFSSDLLKQGEEYRIYLGGSYEGGTEANGCHSGGVYSGGELTETATVTEMTTVLGQSGGFGGWGGFGGGRGGRGMRPQDQQIPQDQQGQQIPQERQTL